MQTDFKEEELKEIESQLSFPNGENGIEMAKMMNETNIRMTIESILALELKKGDCIAELGHGNCDHLKTILSSDDSLYFYGLEISETMQKEAQNINKKWINGQKAEFLLYDGENIPLKDESLHKIMTVNTLYFWKNPLELLNELYRVLKPKGRLVITFAKAEFMEKLPFVRNKFSLFNNHKVLELIKPSSFKVVAINDKEDTVKSKHGEIVERAFTVLVLEK